MRTPGCTTNRGGRVRSKRIFGAISVIVASIIFLTYIDATALLGGVGDGDQEYNCGTCHITQGTGTNTMTASILNPYTEQSITVIVSVTETQLTTNKIIGVVLAKSLASTPSHPSIDGWTITSDPNGNSPPHNYNEKVSEGVGSPVTFMWTLKAPATPGEYHLYARVYHGGGGTPYYEDTTTGLTFTVAESTSPQFVYIDPPESASVGVPIPINATIKDDVGLTAATLYYKGVGETQHSSIDMSLFSGTSSNGNWKAEIPAQATLGRVYFYINATDGVSYTNTEEYQIEITEYLDLVPLNITLSNGNPHVNEELIIRATIKNDGDKDVDNVRITFLDYYYIVAHAKYIGIVSNVTIPKHEVVEVNVWWVPQADGIHKIGVLVDPENMIEEANESNNVLRLNVTVSLRQSGDFTIPTLEELLGIWPILVALAAVVITVVVFSIQKKTRRKWKQ